MSNNNNKGFTLIELLVVISIIGVLSGTVLVGMQGARSKARDAARKRDIQQIEKMLVLSWERNGQFPSEVCVDSSLGSDNCGCPACGGGDCTGNNWCATSQIWSVIVGQGIAPSIPKDPINDATYYYYYEPCCNQDCGGGRTCVGKGCCEYVITANRLEAGGSYSRWGHWE